jgi:flagellar basal-body rod modification protein FlgD
MDSTATAASKPTSDYTTFLKMMTTQLKNQDPLSPIESSDFAVQLATFSGVEQQTKTNDLLTQLGNQFGVLGMAQLAAWVGQEALGDSPVTVSYTPKALADRAVLVATDANGNVVAREDVPLSGGSYQWLGGGITGNPLPSGIYKLSLESYRDGEMIESGGKVESYARILEARGGGGKTTLMLEGGAEVAATDITALRIP